MRPAHCVTPPLILHHRAIIKRQTMIGTELLGCLFKIDIQQQDWVEERHEENGEETCQGTTIVTTETHAAGEIILFF